VGERARALEGVVGLTWADRSVLVTGANGFIGSWLTGRLVEERAHVVALVDGVDVQSEFVRSDIGARAVTVPGRLEDPTTIATMLTEHDVDTVFHLGAQTIVGEARRDPVATFEANVRGTYLLLDACRRAASSVTRVIVASSDKAYGTSEQLPYTEATPLAGRNPYEVSKSCTDLLAQSYAHSFGVPVALARCGNVYGGGDLNWSRIVPGTIRALLRGETPVIRSDGKFVRDYLHVDDVVEAYFALATWLDQPTRTHAPADVAFNFSDESPRTVIEIYDAVCDAWGSRVEPEILGRADGEIHDQSLDAARARELLGWKARVQLTEGLTRTVDWYRHLAGS
jgi:CDP-glucose 4,6-dehydratase